MARQKRVLLLNNATSGTPGTKPKVLIVDDDDNVRASLGIILESGGFEVATAGSVNGALRRIASEVFDVLVSDLHMPGAGDGLTVVSAMRHTNPAAITIILSAFPEMKKAAAAILMQADEILVKPMAPMELIRTIHERLRRGATKRARAAENVATILEQCTDATIGDWLRRVELEPSIIRVTLDREDRCAHLPQLFKDLVSRLRMPLALGTRALISPSAASHGRLRREQGYTAAMLVEESRMLQVSIFQTLQDNLFRVDFSLLLVGVMAIADEVDSQLAQAMASFISESKNERSPA